MHILVNTGGGDAPGLNAVIRAVTLSGLRRGWKVTGIKRGYHGLLEPSGTGLVDLTRDKVRGITHLGGTILGTVNKGHPFEFIVTRDGKQVTMDISDQIMQRFREVKADALIAIGGDGAFRIASKFIAKGMPIVGVPKTIDNDLSHTQATFGFDTAVTVATEAIDRLHSTAESHERIMVVEVMGRYAGWIALHAGVAAGANVILIPEKPFDIDKVCAYVESRFKTRYAPIIVVAEGAHPLDGQMELTAGELDAFGHVRLGGIGERLAAEIEKRTGKEARTTVLGHIQRGGTPTAFDRVLATRFGLQAIDAVKAGDFGKMVALQGTEIVRVDLSAATDELKLVPQERYDEAEVFFG
jgi:phosphofructokinase-like protein